MLEDEAADYYMQQILAERLQKQEVELTESDLKSEVFSSQTLYEAFLAGIKYYKENK
jgi:hypothetical protein